MAQPNSHFNLVIPLDDKREVDLYFPELAMGFSEEQQVDMTVVNEMILIHVSG